MLLPLRLILDVSIKMLFALTYAPVTGFCLVASISVVTGICLHCYDTCSQRVLVLHNYEGDIICGFDFQKHLEICKVELVPCRRDECTDTPKREDFKSHVEKLCKWRPINCDYCSEEIVSCKIEVSGSFSK